MSSRVMVAGLALTCIAVAAASCSSSRETGAAALPNDAGGAEVEAAAPADPYSLVVLDKAHIGSNGSQPDFQKASAELELVKGPFADAKIVIELTSSCFPFEQWKADAPPAGQNWPASCDAFDRNFETALFDPAATGSPGLELVRAITPFGGPLHIEGDVTDIANAANATGGKRRLEVTIPSYSDGAGKVSGSNGGWNVSVRLELTPGVPPRPVLAVVPLVYDSDTKGGTPRPFPFTLPAGTTSARVEYLATGHGGGKGDAACIGPADEFCSRTHTLRADGTAILTDKELWRDDCDKLCTTTKGGPFGSYCKENPCGAPQSVVAPRANWCPGSQTKPIALDVAPFATPGAHTFELAVNKIADGGSWRISAKVFAYSGL
jgi:hypothetical protein